MSKATFAFLFAETRFISSLVNEEALYQATSRVFPTVRFQEKRSNFSFMNCFSNKDLDEYLKILAQLLHKYSKQTHYLYCNHPLFQFVPLLLLARQQHRIPISFFIYIHAVSQDLLGWMIISHLIQPCDLVATPSHAAREALIKISPKYRQVSVLHLPIEKTGGEKKRKPQNSPPVLTYLGRLEESKNVHLLIEIFPDILKRFPDARLQIVGPTQGSVMLEGESCWYRYLKEECKKRNIESSVSFPGAVFDPLEKEKIFCSSDLFLYPAVGYVETFGYAIIEALSCGLPVIATDWNGYKEIIRDSYNGYLVPTWKEGKGIVGVDKKAMIKKIIDFLEGDRDDFRKNALESSERFSFNRFGEKLSPMLERSKSDFDPDFVDISQLILGEQESSLPIGSDQFLSKITPLDAALTLFLGRHNQKQNNILRQHIIQLSKRFEDEIHSHFYSQSPSGENAC